jgi:hypothetical protein
MIRVGGAYCEEDHFIELMQDPMFAKLVAQFELEIDFTHETNIQQPR